MDFLGENESYFLKHKKTPGTAAAAMADKDKGPQSRTFQRSEAAVAAEQSYTPMGEVEVA